ncbi:MAG: hypothetical protein NTX01_05795 [Candidatus Omnitrophica bacterium]|nr:hypothetical protein [Candidatus Omnitrophota bacterium]
MIRLIQLTVVLLLLAYICIPLAEAGGLSTTFSEVTLENLEIGQAYSTKETAGLPLAVMNTGKQAVDLKVELLLPAAEELKPAFKSIPDLSWIKLEKTDFQGIKPNESAITDVIISIPNQRQYKGEQYQVFIWSHTTGTSIGIGLKSKLLLKIKGE